MVRKTGVKIWYIESSGPTNEWIANEFPSAILHIGMLCIDGTKRDLWELEKYRDIFKLKLYRDSANLKFTIFYREYQNGPIRRWLFDKRKKKLALKSAMRIWGIRKSNDK